MANFWYNKQKTELAKSNLNLHTGGDAFKVALVMTNTTADTEDDTDFMDQFTVLDENDDGAYARVTLANQVVNEDLPNNRAEWDADDSVFVTLGAGTRQNQAAVILKFVTNDTDSPPLLFIDTGGFPFDGTGANNTIQWNAEGIAQVA